MTSRLPLHAEFLLLAHDDQTGRRLVDSMHLKAGLAGAAVVELVLQGALRLDGEGKRARLEATGQTVTPELGEVLDRSVGKSPKNAVARIGGAQTWRNRAGDLETATLAELERSGVGAREEEPVLGVFHRKVWREKDPRVEREIVDRVRSALHASGDPDTRTAALVSVAHAAGLLRKVFPDEDKRALAARAKQIGEGDWGGAAVRKAIEEIQAAVIVSAVAAGGAASSSS